MKRILFTLLLLCGIAYGQENIFPSSGMKAVPMSFTIPDGTALGDGTGTPFIFGDCGEWKSKTDTSDWVAVDTLNIRYRNYMRKYPEDTKLDRVREWVYDKIRSMTPFVQGVTAEWNPCKGSSTKEEQYRICSITGIRQRREITYRGWYEKSLTEYEKTVKKFTENKKQ